MHKLLNSILFLNIVGVSLLYSMDIEKLNSKKRCLNIQEPCSAHRTEISLTEKDLKLSAWVSQELIQQNKLLREHASLEFPVGESLGDLEMMHNDDLEDMQNDATNVQENKMLLEQNTLRIIANDIMRILVLKYKEIPQEIEQDIIRILEINRVIQHNIEGEQHITTNTNSNSSAHYTPPAKKQRRNS